MTTDTSEAWIQTYTGRRFFPLDPYSNEIDLRDIAHALSLQCRFAGHTRAHYSIAEHSVRVSRAIESATRGDRTAALAGLLHDASEAYLVDIPRPLKLLPEFAPYREIEARLEARIEERYGLAPGALRSEVVKRFDAVLLATEKRDLLRHAVTWSQDLPAPLDGRIEPWGPDHAESTFIARFHLLA